MTNSLGLHIIRDTKINQPLRCIDNRSILQDFIDSAIWMNRSRSDNVTIVDACRPGFFTVSILALAIAHSNRRSGLAEIKVTTTRRTANNERIGNSLSSLLFNLFVKIFFVDFKYPDSTRFCLGN